ncbi:MAG: RNB domain-containing ribonuclease, partial [Planctomycetes bacterium]|nr:RNB domain-containing ribonuclease [Planctomycetota bacterium]
MESSKLKQAVLDLVLRPGYTPIKPRAIARRLGLGKDEAAELKRVVKKLVHKGRLAYLANHLVGPPAPASEAREDRVTGVFRRTARGFGFVRPRGVATATTDTGEPPPDIYIPARRTGDAATGDLVLVKVKKGRPGKRDDGEDFGPRGEVAEIIQRETHQFVGTYLEMDGSAYVEVDGGLFLQPIHVGDPGAKNVRTDDKVVFEMLRFPSSVRDGEGVITEVLGPAGKPGVDTLSIMREFDLPDRFGEDVLEDARQQAETFEEQTGDNAEDGRTDLTGETILTIDPADARDFDDAISLERLDNGHWRLGVHIADVSHFVRPKTALDREAYSRATSVYLPDRVIPMLPEIISNGLASLQPGVVRFAKTAVIELTADGARVATDVYSSRIKSSKRLAYEEVDQFLEDRKPWRKKLGAKVFELL